MCELTRYANMHQILNWLPFFTPPQAETGLTWTTSPSTVNSPWVSVQLLRGVRGDGGQMRLSACLLSSGVTSIGPLQKNMVSRETVGHGLSSQSVPPHEIAPPLLAL